MSDNILKDWKEQARDVLAAQPQDRRVFDAMRVDNICAMLEQLPTGQLIMQWIKDNDIDIWLDYQCKDQAGGYYIPGSKTVCLSAHMNDLSLVPILAHETRHAWQDSHGFMATLYEDAYTYLKQVRFIEADAAAYEVQICYEMQQQGTGIRPSSFQNFCLDLQEKGLKTLPDFMRGKDVLWSGFCGFFADPVIKNFYDTGSLAVGKMLADTRQGQSYHYRINTEYSAQDYKKPDRYGVNVTDQNSFVLLADMFEGGNYLQDVPIRFLEDNQFIGDLSSRNAESLRALQKQEAGMKTYRRIPALF